MRDRLEGRAAIVTGAARGIGAAIARDLAARGADVAIVDRAGGPAAETTAAVERAGRRALLFEADVADVARAQEVVRETRERLGRLDILVANAGLVRDRAVWNMTEEEWDSVLAVNLKGVFAYARAVAPIFRAQGSGKIVALSSINAFRGKFGQSNYVAAKAGVVGLVKALARELGPSGVNVNAVAPGFVDTPMTAALPEEFRRAAIEESPLGRVATPEDVAGVVGFLCTERARHVTGQVVRVDGGQSL
ncbi:MAG TPA: 3-oxoacyl-ACP reductase FabG [Planctomycetota bacterium]|nr:3-oxoacyl-ACP reductase FabG [Planctomycetota bacterium]